MNALIPLLVAFSISSMLVGCKENIPPTPPETPEVVCGTIQGLTCPEEQYCDFGIGQCKVADAQGICKIKPTICTKEYKPVCGCDGKTYSNACVAAAAGASIDHLGECAPAEPQACGGVAGFPCPEGMKCADDPSDECNPDQGNADCPGICIAE